MKYSDELTPFGALHGIHLVVRQSTKEDLDRYVRRLLQADWESSDSALQLDGDLTPAQVGSTLFLDQARTFLKLVVESDGVGLTPNGWMKLAVVARMLERLDWARRDVEPMRGFLKRIGEQDVKPLRVIHDVCEAAGFVRCRRGRMYVPRRVLPLLAEEQSGRLYRVLFLALLRRAGLSCLYGGDDDAPMLQQSMAVVLWRLHIVAGEWIPFGELPGEILLDSVREEIEASSEFPELALALLWRRAVEPLEWFGLLERDRELKPSGHLDPETRFRKTPLFDRFVKFPPFPLQPPVEAS